MTTAPQNRKVDASEVLVVLPALNENAHIEHCIRSIMQPAKWMAQSKVVVSDGGSQDGTAEIVKGLRTEFPNLWIIDNPGQFQSAGLNIAVQEAAEPQHRFMVRCDVHAHYPEGYVRDVVEMLRQKDVASVATVMDAVGDSPLQRVSAWIVDTPLGSGGSAHRGGAKSGYVDHGHHAGFRLDWFRRIGGYDPKFTHNEDAEYDVRLIRAGGKIWLEAGIRVTYFMRRSLKSLARQYWNYGRGRARTILKHSARPRLRQVVPALNLVMLLFSMVAGFVWTPAFAWCAVYSVAILLVSLVGMTRQREANGLLAGPAVAAMHIGWGLGFVYQFGSELWHRRTGKAAVAA